MKSLFWGILLVIIIGIGGLVYRNAVENPSQAVACPVNYFQCPDGTQVPHLAGSCDFPTCPPPNVSFPDSNVAFALPDGFTATATPDAASIAAYSSSNASTSATIVIRRFSINASSTALATIEQTALSATSGAPVPFTSLSSTAIGGNNFTVAPIERYEGTIDTAYYLARGSDVLRFDAIDTNIPNWSADGLDITQLPAEGALRKLLNTLQ
jgi:hypothetical protein